ncbi:hypothetical protein Tco_1368756 [Tanacetum coccineum]
MGISDDTCDVPVCENSSTFDALKNHSLILSDSNDDGTSSDDDDFEDIEYVEASPPESKLVSLEEVNDVDQEKEEIDLEDILRIQDSPSYFLSPGADSDSFFEEFNTSLSYSVNSLPEFETFSDHKEETNSGSTTTHVDNSLPEYDLFHFEIELDQGELTNVVMETIFGEPRVHMLNIFTLPTPWNSEFTPFRTFPWVTVFKFSFSLPDLDTRFSILSDNSLLKSKSERRDFYHVMHLIIMANLPPLNNDPNVPEDEHAPAPEHTLIAPNPAPIQLNDYLADNEESEEEEEPIPEQAPAAPDGFAP